MLTIEDGCLLLAGRVVFWPRGTTWDASARAVLFDDGSSLMVGQRFEGAGGSFTLENLTLALEAERAEAIADCMRRTKADVAVFAYAKLPDV